MADLIERSAVLHDLESLWDYSTVDGITASTVLKQVKTDVKNIPTVDAVPVVRCADCADYQTDWKPSCPGVHYCATMDSMMRPNDFCSYGERRDGKEDQQE